MNSFSPTKKCKQCNAPIVSDNSRYCNNCGAPIAKGGFRARMDSSRMGWFTIALLVWLTLYEVIFKLINITDIVSLTVSVVLHFLTHTVNVQYVGLLRLIIIYGVSGVACAILYALAIVGILSHYYAGQKASHLRWGPICGIVGAAFDVTQGTVLYPLNGSPTPLAIGAIFSWIFVASIVGLPLYIEYLKEGPPETTERVTHAALSGRLSAALHEHIKRIEVSVDKTQKRIRRNLTLLTVAFAIVLLGNFIVTQSLTSNRILWNLSGAAVFAVVSVFFLIVAIAFSSLLKKPRFVLLLINYSAGLDSVAAAEKRAVAKDARKRLAIFVLVYAVPVFSYVAISPLYPTTHAAQYSVEFLVSFAMFALSALACFLFGYWVLTRTIIGTVTLDESPLYGLFGPSIGVLPKKIRAGEAQTVLMDFDVAAASDSAMSSSEKRVHDPVPVQPYYEVELQAAGATVDGEKRCTIYDVPATCESMWNCSFTSGGTQALHLLFYEVRPARSQHGPDAFVKKRVFSYVHNVRVDATFSASSDNAVSMLGIGVTAVSVFITVGSLFRF